MSSKRVSFFGATGGCCFAALRRSLAQGHHCRVLVRNPAKLQSMLREHHLEKAASLEIIVGDVTDVHAVSEALTFGEEIAEVIVCGIGGAPSFQFSLKYPITMANGATRICYNGTRAILSALSTLQSHRTSAPAQPPLLLVVSTVGVASTYREWPLLMWLFYGWMLNAPIEDKRLAHDALLTASVSGGEGASGKNQGPLVRFVSVRPSHLSEGPGKGMAKIRAGCKVVGGKSEVMGYSIDKDDVGCWMFEEFLRGEVKTKWVNECVVVTT